MDALFYEFTLESEDPGGSVRKRSVAFMRALESSRGPNETEAAAREITEQLLSRRYPPHLLEKLVEHWRIAGYEISEQKLFPTTPGPTALGPEISKLERELQSRQIEPAATHYRQAVENFVERNWESSNGQVRSFLEDFLIKVGKTLSRRERSEPVAALQDLKNADYLDDAEFNQIKAFWAGIQDNGPHRGLSDEEESLFRLHVATCLARYLLFK